MSPPSQSERLDIHVSLPILNREHHKKTLNKVMLLALKGTIIQERNAMVLQHFH